MKAGGRRACRIARRASGTTVIEGSLRESKKKQKDTHTSMTVETVDRGR